MILIVIVVCQSFIILNYKHQLKQQKEQLINQKQSEEPKLPIEEKVEKEKKALDELTTWIEKEIQPSKYHLILDRSIIALDMQQEYINKRLIIQKFLN